MQLMTAVASFQCPENWVACWAAVLGQHQGSGAGGSLAATDSMRPAWPFRSLQSDSIVCSIARCRDTSEKPMSQNGKMGARLTCCDCRAGRG